MAVAVILGSAFSRPALGGRALAAVAYDTPFGPAVLHRWARPDGESAWVLFRHGAPHRFLPHQIPYRAHAHALAAAGVRALLVTGSAGVLADDVPLFSPLAVADLLMPDNRLPDGTACTMFVEPAPGQGHLVGQEGLLSPALTAQVERLAAGADWPIARRVTFAYAPGPRTKTPAENAYWARAGAQVNSMTVAPEVVLANELEIAVAAVVIGHKRSRPAAPDGRTDADAGAVPPDDGGDLRASLVRARAGAEALAVAFLDRGELVPWGNALYRFGP